MASNASYSRLPQEKDHEMEDLQGNGEDESLLSSFPKGGLDTTSGRQPRRNGWTFFIGACGIALVISALNLSFISGLNVWKTFKASSAPVKTPNAYHGLEKVEYKTSPCRTRPTFPRAVSVFEGDSLKSAKRIYDPYDDITVSFGGKVQAYFEFFAHDFGLENCTMNANFPSDGQSSAPAGTPIEVYHVHKQGDLSSKHLLDTLHFYPDTNLTTRTFPCQAQSPLFFVFSCPDERCNIQYPLLGVSDRTWSPESVGKEGLRVQQYEALQCIPATPPRV